MAEDRLDRLEALTEKILEGLQETKQITREVVEGLKETKQGLKETKQRTDSNARAIEALAAQSAEDRKQREEDRKQWEKDRKGIYLLLGQLTRSMSDFYDIQSDFYNRFQQIDARQAEIAKIIEQLKGDEEENQS